MAVFCHTYVRRASWAYGVGMIRAILTVLGVVLSIWLIWSVLGVLITTLKFLLTIALIAVAGFFVVKVIARR
jgi:hypothetical protein